MDDNFEITQSDSAVDIKDVIGHKDSGYYLVSWLNGERSADLFVSDVSNAVRFEIVLNSKGNAVDVTFLTPS